MDSRETVVILEDINKKITERMMLIDEASRALGRKDIAYYREMEKGAKEYEAVEMAIRALKHTERCEKCRGACESMAISKE